jgi:histidinol-phosphate/aromatic aminotransferase/cobyric acid decarboxylase-like protein
MDPRSVLDVEQVAHGGTDDASLLDFSVGINAEVPGGLAPSYESSLSASRQFQLDDHAEFRTAAASHLGCDSRNVVPVAGYVAGVRLALGVTVEVGDSVLVPVPACGEYTREARLQGATVTRAPVTEMLERDPAPHAAVVVAPLGSPTGYAYDEAALRAYAERCRDADTLLLVDETFLGFTDRPSLAGEPGVVVVQSLTNLFGLPGLRAGVAAAVGDLRERLERARGTWTLSVPAVSVATECLGHREFLERTRDRIREERARLVDELSALGFDVHPGDGPLVLFETTRPVSVLKERTREHGIAVRDATTYRRLDSHVRVTVRRPEENDRLLRALERV